MIIFFLMIRRPPRSTLTDTLFPDTTLFRSADEELAVGRVRVRRTRNGANAPDVRLGGKFRLQVGLLRSAHAGARGIAALRHEAVDHPVKQNAVVKAFAGQFLDRSEERRGGKEWVSTCRSRWTPYH